MYAATVILGRSERDFWRMTPRKLTALVKVHSDINGSPDDEKKEKQPTGYIDQLF